MNDRPFIIALGPLDWLDTNNERHFVPGREVFEDLAARHLWYTGRNIAGTADTPALFYLKGQGVIARAVIESFAPVDDTDETLLRRFGIPYVRTRMKLKEVVTFEPPVDLKPLIDRLSFIKNKGSRWGTALMGTPRRIPYSDFELILSAVK